MAALILAAADFTINPPSRNFCIVRVIWIVAVCGCADGCGFAGGWVTFQIQFIYFTCCGGRIPPRYLCVLFVRDHRLCFGFGGLDVGQLFRLSRWWCLWVAAFRRRRRVVRCLGLREYGMCFLSSCSAEDGVVADLDSFCSG